MLKLLKDDDLSAVIGWMGRYWRRMGSWSHSQLSRVLFSVPYSWTWPLLHFPGPVFARIQGSQYGLSIADSHSPVVFFHHGAGGGHLGLGKFGRGLSSTGSVTVADTVTSKWRLLKQVQIAANTDRSIYFLQILRKNLS